MVDAKYPSPSAGPIAPGLLLGLALGGFFDGILLHQVLQWHHLLSALDQGPMRDLRLQVLADGLFHALMYLFLAAGLFLLWRARAAVDRPGAGRRLAAWVLAGFGGWHVLDTLVSHWLTGIHRVRMDVPNPLFWDLLWLALFGLFPLALAAWLGRRSRRGSGGPDGPAMALALAAVAVLAGAQAARAPGQSDQDLLVVFGPGTSPAQAMAALGQVDGRVTWTDARGAVWAVQTATPGAAARLYREGAWLVSRPGVSLGCVSWLRRAGNGAVI